VDTGNGREAGKIARNGFAPIGSKTLTKKSSESSRSHRGIKIGQKASLKGGLTTQNGGRGDQRRAEAPGNGPLKKKGDVFQRRSTGKGWYAKKSQGEGASGLKKAPRGFGKQQRPAPNRDRAGSLIGLGVCKRKHDHSARKQRVEGRGAVGGTPGPPVKTFKVYSGSKQGVAGGSRRKGT